MKNKLFVLLLTLVLCASFALGLAACGGTSPSSVSRETRSLVCKTIGDTIVDTAVGSAVGSSAPLSAVGSSTLRTAVVFAETMPEDEIYTESNSDINQWILLATSYIYMVSEFYGNENFLITDKTVALTSEVTQSGSIVNADILLACLMDPDAGEVKIDMEFTSETTSVDNSFSTTQHSYIQVSADYDFAANKAEKITIHIANDMGDDTFYFLHANYSNGAIKGIASSNTAALEQVKGEVINSMNEFEKTFDDAVDVGDFSKEVSAANDYLLSKINQ